MAIAIRNALYLSMSELAEAQATSHGGDRRRSSMQRIELISRVQSIALSASVVAYDGSTPAGIALTALRGERAWLYDIAVVPAYRRRRVGSRMLQAVVEALERAGANEVELDVAATRPDALSFFEQHSFKHVRTYLSFAASAAEIERRRAYLPTRSGLVAGSARDVIAAYAASQDIQPAPCWGRSLASLIAYPDAHVIRRLENDRELGLIVCLALAPRGGDSARLTPLFVRMVPQAGADALRDTVVAVGRYLLGTTGAWSVRIALEPAGSTLASGLQDLGMPVVEESYDLRRALR